MKLKQTDAVSQAYFPKHSIILIQGVIDPLVLDKISWQKNDTVFIMEGRPSFEAAQSNAKVLLKRGIKPYIITDNMAGFLFFKGWVKQAMLACQTADKSGALCDSGALIVAVLAKKFKVPVKLVPGKIKTRFLGDPSTVAPKGIKGYVPLVEWVRGKYFPKR